MAWLKLVRMKDEVIEDQLIDKKTDWSWKVDWHRWLKVNWLNVGWLIDRPITNHRQITNKHISLMTSSAAIFFFFLVQLFAINIPFLRVYKPEKRRERFSTNNQNSTWKWKLWKHSMARNGFIEIHLQSPLHFPLWVLNRRPLRHRMQASFVLLFCLRKKLPTRIPLGLIYIALKWLEEKNSSVLNHSTSLVFFSVSFPGGTSWKQVERCQSVKRTWN